MNNTVVYISLTQGKTTVIDLEDFEKVRKYKWTTFQYRHSAYAGRSTPKIKGKKDTMFMHRLILDAHKGREVDHINGDGLDNRRCNIRLCSKSQNQANRKKQLGLSSQYKGVSWHKKDRKWMSSIKLNGKSIYLGEFNREIDAAYIYDDAARKYFGEFANTNF